MNPSISFKWMLISGVLFALFSVVIGAFAAHGLKGIISEYGLGLFETAARYQMYHGLALVLCASLSQSNKLNYFWLKLSAGSFIFGTFVFCGSLYLLGLTNIKWLGAITPIGGVGFILGWIFLLITSLKTNQMIPSNEK